MAPGDDGVGEDAAVAPAAHTQKVGVGQPDGDHISMAASRSRTSLLPQSAEIAVWYFFAAARAAAVVHVHHHVAVGGEELPLKTEGVRVLPLGPP